MEREEAMDRLRDEIAKAADRPEIALIGEYLTSRLAADPEIGDKLTEKEKTIDGAFGAVKEWARKNQKNGYCAVTDEKAFEIVCGYYGIEAGAQANAGEPHPALRVSSGASAPMEGLDLDALLGGAAT